MEFRKLRADEIDVRIGRINQYYVSLLLYKDARCDQNILDESVGAMNWQRHHSRDNANCVVSIWDADKKQWIEKEDTGTESNTESEKGLASDSFKRACFNWGIGRELYTSPQMSFNVNETSAKDGKCYDKFIVTSINYEGNKIKDVTILNTKTKISHTFSNDIQVEPEGNLNETHLKAIRQKLKADKVDEKFLCEVYKVDKLEDMSPLKLQNAIMHWDKVVEQWNAKQN